MSHDDALSAEQVVHVEREIELDASIDDVWSLVCRADLWLADEGTLNVGDGPDALGRLVERGIARTTRLDRLDDGRRIVFHWWDERGDGSDASRVEITLVPAEGTTRLVVNETLPVAAAAQATRSEATSSASRSRALLGSGANWEIRLMCLASQAAFRSALVLV